jgi:cytidylate kinase
MACTKAIDVVTIGGFPGSGTSTVCELLGRRTGWRHLDAGRTFREMAAEAGESMAAFCRRAECDPELDRGLDARMTEAVRTPCGGMILEGRLTGWMVVRAQLPALKVWIFADMAVRADRVGNRDGQSVEEALQEMVRREQSERTRYRDHHGIDIEDLSIYGLVIDSGKVPAPQVADRIAERLPDSG